MRYIISDYQQNIMLNNNLFFKMTILRLNLALVMQAIRAQKNPVWDEQLKMLLRNDVQNHRADLVQLLISCNLAYIDVKNNRVVSHNGLVHFADIRTKMCVTPNLVSVRRPKWLMSEKRDDKQLNKV